MRIVNSLVFREKLKEKGNLITPQFERILVVLLMSLMVNPSFSQSEDFLKQIVPLSPNAAAMAKYGETPVGHFTGVPNITIPLYTIKSGTLELPLALNYHAGGNRVETIASWVGLGWNLGSIPSISRSVRGLPDEGGGGYFNQSGNTVKQIFEERHTNTVAYDNFMVNVRDGFADAEADIFSYNIVGESGRFFYNQDLDEFITVPKSNVKIELNGDNFTITSSNGIVYVFNEKEETTTDTSTPGTPIITAWYASSISDPNSTDQISFSYRYDESTLFKTRTSVSRYVKLTTEHNRNPLQIPFSSINSIHQVVTRPLDRITFKNGYIQFNPDMQNTDRDDLQGGHFLKDLKVFDKHDSQIIHYQFTYDYLQGGGCPDEDPESKKWLVLEKLDQVSIDPSDDNLTHKFYYDQDNIPPCRMSPAQDYWGFYNGQNSNQNLIPEMVIPIEGYGSNGLLKIDGADRSISPSASQFGILQMITYPTGGRTEFDFDINEIGPQTDLNLPPNLNDVFRRLGLDDGGPGPDVAGTGTSADPYRIPFSLNIGPHYYVNGNNQDGGLYVNITIVAPPAPPGCNDCDISNGQTHPYAYFTIKDTNSGNIVAFPTIGGSLYLPDGDYEMTASFTPALNNYSDFVFLMEWKEPLLSPPNVGGLRIRETRHYPNEFCEAIVKRYRYNDGLNSNESSGDLFYTFIPNYFDVLQVQDVEEVGGDLPADITYITDYLRIRSYTNTQQVTHSGSLIGYKTVIEETDSEDTGIAVFEYTHARDESIDSQNPPFPPAPSVESDRGQLLKASYYKKINNDYFPVKRVINTYSSQAYNSNPISSEPVYNLKTSDHYILASTNQPFPDQLTTLYLTESNWSELETSKEIHYGSDITENIEIVTNYTYNPTHLQVESIKKNDSYQREAEERWYYTQDLVLSDPEAEISRQKLAGLNKLSTVLREEKYYNGQLTERSTTNNKRFNVAEQVFPSEVLANLRGAGSVEESRAQFLDFDTEGNLLEQRLTNNTRISYIWGYNRSLPIAKIENATYSDVLSEVANLQTLSDADDDNCTSPTCKEQLLRVDLNALRDLPALKDARITTYTYDPLVGMTSQTDPNGQTIWYEYDGFNRLKVVKDFEGNPLTKHEYHYTSQ